MTSCICCNTSLEQDMREEHDMESPSGSLLKEPDQGQGNKDKFEDNLMKTISGSNFEQIEKAVTPRALQRCESNSLLMAMKVNFKLRGLAEEMGPEVAKFKQLANSVEEFTYCLLDPLKSRKSSHEDRWCEQFGDYSLDFILDDAIEFEQKKFFTHPAVHTEMHRKWRGRNFLKTPWKSWQLKLFNIWCIFDLVFSPFLLAAFSLLKKKWKDSVPDIYLAYLESPYFKFVRDTLSHLILLALHYALCLSPSTIAFSGLEWIILVFFVGRYLVELKQICCVNQRVKKTQDIGADGARSRYWKIISMYLSDYWNKLDFITLAVYFTIFILRVVTWANSGSVANNRALIVAGYLYSFNTLCLTLRAFGHVMEQSETFGITQIALFSILNDVRTVFWQFMAAMLGFSVAITKVYVSEKSFIANGSDRHEIACKSSGISCWWSIFIHLGWSLLGVSEDVDPLTSVDLPSVTLGRILFAAFLIMGVILLINMLIALLSNTYQRTEENAIMEWSFKRAIAVQTYGDYDPIPVPLNIIYRIFIVLRRLVRVNEATEESGEGGEEKGMLKQHVVYFEEEYFAEYGNMFPVTEEKRLDFVLKETERNRQMVSQILSATFTSQGKDGGVLCSGQKAWEFDKGIQIEGPLLTFECADQSCPVKKHCHGVRYRTCFSPEFPHFEVTIIETGRTAWLGIGVVHEDYDVNEMPGYDDDSVGYHTDDGNIFQNHYDPVAETEGPVVARRGDRVRCTVMFESMREGSGQVPVIFALNGKKIVIRGGGIFMDYDDSERLFPHIGMTEGSSVLAKMCARESGNDYCSQSQELNSDLADEKEDEVCHDLENQKGKSELADTSGDDLGSRDDPINQSLQLQENLEAVISREVKKATRSLEEKLDALLERMSEKK